MLIGFTPYGRMGASARVRVMDWISFTGIEAEVHDFAGFRNNGAKHIVTHLPLTVRAQARTWQQSHRHLERTLVHRELTPFSSGGLIERVGRNSQLLVYDFDDALMWSPRRRADWLWSRAANCERAVGVADVVIAGSEVLAEWASTRNHDVRLIPSCVNLSDFDKKTDFGLGRHPRLVWIGSPSGEINLKLIQEPLLQVHRAFNARLTVISAGNQSLGPLDAMVDRLNWSTKVQRALGSFDVGIAPLLDAPWERGKCAYKVLQYGAAGLPTVVSPVGANAVAASRLGLPTAQSPAEWINQLTDLITSSDYGRRSLGEAARQGVKRDYTFARWAPEWLNAVGEGAA